MVGLTCVDFMVRICCCVCYCDVFVVLCHSFCCVCCGVGCALARSVLVLNGLVMGLVWCEV